MEQNLGLKHCCKSTGVTLSLVTKKNKLEIIYNNIRKEKDNLIKCLINSRNNLIIDFKKYAKTNVSKSVDNLRHKIAVEQFPRVEKEDNITNDVRKWGIPRTDERAVSKQRTLTGISRRNSPKLLTAGKLFSHSHIFLRHRPCHVHARLLHTPYFSVSTSFCTHCVFLSTLSWHIPLRLAFAILSRSYQFSFVLVDVFVREPFICLSFVNPDNTSMGPESILTKRQCPRCNARRKSVK